MATNEPTKASVLIAKFRKTLKPDSLPKRFTVDYQSRFSPSCGHTSIFMVGTLEGFLPAQGIEVVHDVYNVQETTEILKPGRLLLRADALFREMQEEEEKGPKYILYSRGIMPEKATELIEAMITSMGPSEWGMVLYRMAQAHFAHETNINELQRIVDEAREQGQPVAMMSSDGANYIPIIGATELAHYGIRLDGKGHPTHYLGQPLPGVADPKQKLQ
jgi:hypothetical protein